MQGSLLFGFFFFNDTATTEIYTLSLHDALPIYPDHQNRAKGGHLASLSSCQIGRSEEHTSELQSRGHLVCRLLLEKKRNNQLPSTLGRGSPLAHARGPLHLLP